MVRAFSHDVAGKRLASLGGDCDAKGMTIEGRPSLVFSFGMINFADQLR
jgi:hypothetical protein